MKSLGKNDIVEWFKIYRAMAVLEAILLLVLTFCYGGKIDDQKKIIEDKTEIIEKSKTEVKRLKLVEQDFEENKEYINECFKEMLKKGEEKNEN